MSTSSALKHVYRDLLRENVDVFFVHLVGSQELILERMKERKDHFMPPSLLASQFDTLENLGEDENGVVISVEDPIEVVVEKAIEAVRQYQASKA